MSQIKNILFDLGGVILNINYHLTIDAFKKIGFTDFEAFYTQKNQTEFFNLFETGHLSVSEFHEYIKKNCPSSITNNQINTAWNAMLLDLPIYRIEFLEMLSKKYQIYLLSNTNEVHISEFKKTIDATVGYDRFKNVFNACYYSSEIGFRKPKKACFNYVLKTNDLDAKETLFIDDSIQHIKGASSLGILSYLLKPGEDIVKVVPDIIQ